ncbi:RsmE family RNA methyltransferase [Arabiibacter massiliensis]|uniref:RsmE family RNA methyltransferase n=1 Tax=Arabiibacter massiliensis TaxID=1870985 RepID=UPI0009BB48FF|nr:16S rRNA (uracil(1498)-N(3))-methyltransferase [Arabiibacter massiliensis]
MSLPHFYLDDQVLADEPGEVFSLRLSAGDAKHARVLRLAPGEHVAVVDAGRDYFECEVVSFDGMLPDVRIAQRLERAAARPSVVLVQGLAKGDKMETVIRHATELGVAEFLPLSCERSVVRLDAKKGVAKAERWRAIAKSAAMQSGQPAIPEVREPMALARACGLLADADAVLVCWEEAPGTARIEDALEGSPPDARVAVVVGPEGGLAAREVDALLACNPRASLVTLGPSILRTETAGIVAPALVLYELRRAAR